MGERPCVQLERMQVVQPCGDMEDPPKLKLEELPCDPAIPPGIHPKEMKRFLENVPVPPRPLWQCLKSGQEATQVSCCR